MGVGVAMNPMQFRALKPRADTDLKWVLNSLNPICDVVRFETNRRELKDQYVHMARNNNPKIPKDKVSHSTTLGQKNSSNISVGYNCCVCKEQDTRKASARGALFESKKKRRY